MAQSEERDRSFAELESNRPPPESTQTNELRNDAVYMLPPGARTVIHRVKSPVLYQLS